MLRRTSSFLAGFDADLILGLARWPGIILHARFPLLGAVLAGLSERRTVYGKQNGEREES